MVVIKSKGTNSEEGPHHGRLSGSLISISYIIYFDDCARLIVLLVAHGTVPNDGNVQGCACQPDFPHETLLHPSFHARICLPYLAILFARNEFSQSLRWRYWHQKAINEFALHNSEVFICWTNPQSMSFCSTLGAVRIWKADARNCYNIVILDFCQSGNCGIIVSDRRRHHHGWESLLRRYKDHDVVNIHKGKRK